MKFIGIYDNIITQNECDTIINYYETHPNKQPGKIGHGIINPNYKDSMDVQTYFSDQLCVHSIINNALKKGLDKYKMEHKSLQYTDLFNLYNRFNIQKYKPGGGFKSWHHETTNFDNYPNKQTTRMLVWMLNLNDCPDGGTMFLEQDYILEAKSCRLSIWPAGFTHVHKGQISNTREKYIATGWFNYVTPENDK